MTKINTTLSFLGPAWQLLQEIIFAGKSNICISLWFKWKTEKRSEEGKHFSSICHFLFLKSALAYNRKISTIFFPSFRNSLQSLWNHSGDWWMFESWTDAHPKSLGFWSCSAVARSIDTLGCAKLTPKAFCTDSRKTGVALLDQTKGACSPGSCFQCWTIPDASEVRCRLSPSDFFAQ